jgi:hypothetical protein
MTIIDTILNALREKREELNGINLDAYRGFGHAIAFIEDGRAEWGKAPPGGESEVRCE